MIYRVANVPSSLNGVYDWNGLHAAGGVRSRSRDTLVVDVVAGPDHRQAVRIV